MHGVQNGILVPSGFQTNAWSSGGTVEVVQSSCPSNQQARRLDTDLSASWRERHWPEFICYGKTTKISAWRVKTHLFCTWPQKKSLLKFLKFSVLLAVILGYPAASIVYPIINGMFCLKTCCISHFSLTCIIFLWFHCIMWAETRAGPNSIFQALKIHWCLKVQILSKFITFKYIQ